MHVIEELLGHYDFTSQDETHRKQLADILLPVQDQFADEFYAMLMENPYTASFFKTQAAIDKRKQTIKYWLRTILTDALDHRLLLKLERIGKVHVRIGLDGHYVNASMNFVRRFCHQVVLKEVKDKRTREALEETLDKLLDLSLDVMTSSYREAELKQVFISKQAEYWLVRWAERIMHGLNLVLMLGLLILAAGVSTLLGSDVLFALHGSLEQGVIRALGSLLILWMMIELLHTQVEHLKGGKFNVRIFVDLALVAFIRKVFVASIEQKDPLTFALLISSLLVLGLIYFLIGRAEKIR